MPHAYATLRERIQAQGFCGLEDARRRCFVNVSTGFCVPSFLVPIFLGKVLCN